MCTQLGVVRAAPEVRGPVANSLCDRQWQVQLLQEQHTEQMRVHCELSWPFRNALKFALQEATAQDVMRQTRGCEAICDVGHFSKSKLEARFTLFIQGGWQELIRASVICDDQVQASSRATTG